jgi:hypothetical protein
LGRYQEWRRLAVARDFDGACEAHLITPRHTD